MIESPLVALLFILASSLISGLSSAVQLIGKSQAEEIAKTQGKIAKVLFQRDHREALPQAFSLSKNIYLIAYVGAALIFSLHIIGTNLTANRLVLSVLSILTATLISDSLMRIFSSWRPKTYFRIFSQIGAFFILPFWPITLLLHKIQERILSDTVAPSSRIKEKILEILDDSEIASHIDPNDQKLILSIVSFKDRIAREVMVPRVDITTLSVGNTIKEAAQLFSKEGYSRIPVWKENLDTIVGVLYYKDLLNMITTSKDFPKELEAPIEPFLKPVVYAPETKKISHLLQEFRTQQIHLAIVVDEYGGTEGIVTIEDILEELVGEIADEYDVEEEALFTSLPSGGWLVDAKMTILDIDEELGISLPQSPEYDTLGGFIFHKAGSIPSKGWRLHQDDFDLEILSSSERAIEKIRVIPH